MDEATLHSQPGAAPAWHPEGKEQPPVRLSCGPDRGLRAAALLSVSGRLLRRVLPEVTADRVSEMYLEAGESHPEAEEVTVVLDNWPVHFVGRARAALEKDPRIRLLRLPTYSPWLNPVEKLWRMIRQRMEHNHPWAGDRDELAGQAERELERAAENPEELLRYVGLSKQ